MIGAAVPNFSPAVHLPERLQEHRPEARRLRGEGWSRDFQISFDHRNHSLLWAVGRRIVTRCVEQILQRVLGSFAIRLACGQSNTLAIERLWRSVKYEEVYPRDYADGWEAESSLANDFRFYCEERIHQALGYQTPAAVYGQSARGKRRR